MPYNSVYMISYDDFAKVELKTAHVVTAERVPNSEKLLRLSLQVGDTNETGELVERIVLAGIGKQYEPELLVGKDIVIVANLEPRSLMGEVSNGMIVAATNGDGVISILQPDKPIGGGWKIK
ncbi:MAG: methionyl-tRNA synthetase [Parcubacteria group bacterium LiPW_41]|nr:MAG: methionyl-tRNA synthetase [Parcubacteria group bacterium LiPW_41]